MKKQLSEPWCYDCQVFANKDINQCTGCETAYGVNGEKLPPTKFKNMYEEEIKMNVVIIGSISKMNEMKECKKYWERFGHKVDSPCDDGRESMSLIELQSTWIEKIEKADLIVAIPKDIKMQGHGASTYVYDFGESTSYEMAIALHLNKQIVFW